jgi:hypothetical protein
MTAVEARGGRAVPAGDADADRAVRDGMDQADEIDPEIEPID